MLGFKEIKATELKENVFDIIGDQWMLIAAKKDDRVNMMTASWGGFGVLWGKKVVYIFVRPQRFTKEFLDAADGFSCTFYEKKFRQELSLCGQKSGRDTDKVDVCDFDVLESDNIPYFAQAHIAVICKKLYRQRLDPACFMDDSINKSIYPENDHHFLYVGEIEKVLTREIIHIEDIIK